MIKGIFFDAADVFYRRPEPTSKYVSNLLAANGYAPEPVGGKFELETLRNQANNGFLSPAEYWSQVLLMRGVQDLQQRKAMVDQINDYSNHVLAIPGGREALAGLKQRGFILGIVTDTMYPIETKLRWLANVGVAEFIDVVACSTVLGVHKPDPAIYLSALQQAHLTPSASAFVGHDTIELDGARKAGLATVAVNYDPNAKADYYCASLVDLLNVPIFQKSLTSRQRNMNHDIQAIFLDVGNTLRIVVKDEPFAAHARQQLATLIGATEPIDVLFERLGARWKVYRKWSLENLAEASEKELWTRFLLPDFPVETITPLSGKLTRLWRDKDGRRVPRHDVTPTVVELSQRGYILGIIANTITETEIPDWLKANGLTNYFKTVILSSKVRYRKPGPEIYWEATRCAGVAPAHSAYVGDNPIRDVAGARKAGFALVVILPEPGKSEQDLPISENKPDVIIQEFGDLLKIFPPR